MTSSSTISLFADLQARGLVADKTELDMEGFLSKSRSLFCGFDPTADSLHVGSLLPLVTLMRFQRAGHSVVILLGGATGLIGDPSGKKAERQLQSPEAVEANIKALKLQVRTIFTRSTSAEPKAIVNNADWFTGMTAITFLRDIGKHFSVGSLLARDTIQTRLEAGISFTEFAYTLLQAHDFVHLAKELNVTLQIGATDQWGNITAGLDLLRKSQSGVHAAGLTLPLLTKADGTKFGKSESGAVWLDPKKTTPFELFQFFLRQPDSQIVPLLKKLTFLSLENITQLEAELTSKPEERRAHRTLAWEITALVHGNAAADLAQVESSKLFSDAPLDASEAKAFAGTTILIELLVTLGFASSKGDATRTIQGGGVRWNDIKVTLEQARQPLLTLVGDEKFGRISVGKHKRAFIAVV